MIVTNRVVQAKLKAKQKAKVEALAKKGVGPSQPMKRKMMVPHNVLTPSSRASSSFIIGVQKKVSVAQLASSREVVRMVTKKTVEVLGGIYVILTKKRTTLVPSIVEGQKKKQKSDATSQSQDSPNASSIGSNLVLPPLMIKRQVPRKKDTSRPNPNLDLLLMNPKYEEERLSY